MIHKLLAEAMALALAATAAPLGASPTPAVRLAALPLTEIPSSVRSDTLAVFYSGDGGWAAIDRGVAQHLTKAGVPVVGYDSLRYFWTKRSPQGAADDLSAVIRHYTAAWGRKRVVLVGYSFGAGALPIIVQHLPAAQRAQVRTMVLVGTEPSGELQFQPGDWLNQTSPSAYSIAPVLLALRGLPMACIYGDQERYDACAKFPATAIRRIRLPGDHHFNGDYEAVGRAVIRAAGL